MATELHPLFLVPALLTLVAAVGEVRLVVRAARAAEAQAVIPVFQALLILVGALVVLGLRVVAAQAAPASSSSSTPYPYSLS